MNTPSLVKRAVPGRVHNAIETRYPDWYDRNLRVHENRVIEEHDGNEVSVRLVICPCDLCQTQIKDEIREMFGVEA